MAHLRPPLHPAAARPPLPLQRLNNNNNDDNHNNNNTNNNHNDYNDNDDNDNNDATANHNITLNNTQVGIGLVKRLRVDTIGLIEK